jgi:hypothetical protein
MQDSAPHSGSTESGTEAIHTGKVVVPSLIAGLGTAFPVSIEISCCGSQATVPGWVGRDVRHAGVLTFTFISAPEYTPDLVSAVVCSDLGDSVLSDAQGLGGGLGDERLRPHGVRSSGCFLAKFSRTRCGPPR